MTNNRKWWRDMQFRYHFIKQAGRENDRVILNTLGSTEQSTWHEGRKEADPSHINPYNMADRRRHAAMTDATRTPTGDRIREAQQRVLQGVRPWIFFNELGELVLQLNEPNRDDPNEIGAVIMGPVILSKHHPQNVEDLCAVLRGWVMGVASTIPEADAE